MQGSRVARDVASGVVLVVAILSAASQIYGALFCIWAAGGPPTSVPALWSHRAEAYLCYASVWLLLGLAAILAIRAWRFTRPSLLLATVAVALLAVPHLREFWAVDLCLDRGGRWNAAAFACQK
jgi:hypothetical protein